MSVLTFATSSRHKAESPDGTTVTGTPSPFIYASSTPGSAGAQNAISISSSGTILVNGTSPGGSGVTTLYKVNKSVFQFNGTNWWGPITVSSTGPTPLTAPQPTITLSNNTLAASSPIGTVVGTISTTTGLANGTIGTGAYTWTYALSGTNATNFQVVGSSLQTAVANLSGTQGPFTVTATPSPAIVGGPFTLPVSVTVSADVIPYTSTAPSSLALTTGATSPLGWTVDFFDDFNGTFTRTSNGAWVQNRGNPNSFTTGAQYAGSNAVYGCNWNAAWGGYSGNDVISNVAMSSSNLVFNVTNVGGTITTSSVVMSFPSPWGLWEWRVKASHGANGSRTGCNMGLWLSHYPWPDGAEIDVIETAVGGGTQGGITCNIHCGSSGAGVQLFSSSSLPNATTWDDGNYHVYAALLTPSYIAIYVDGVLMGSGHASTYLNTVSTATNPPNSSVQYTWGYQGNIIVGTPSNPSDAFANNLWMLMGYEVTGSASTAQCPMSASVDWFRHSILNPATGGPHV